MQQETGKWNLAYIYSSPGEWEKALAGIAVLTDKITAMKGRVTTSAQNLHDTLRLNDELGIKLSRAFSYARMQFDTNMGDEEAKARYEKIDALASKVNERLAFLESELLSLSPETFLSYKQEKPELDVYSHAMEKLFRKKEHILTPEMEEILAKMRSLGASFKKVYDDITVNDLVYPEIEGENGEPVTANEANYRRCMTSYDRGVRKRYFKALLSTYAGHRNSIASTYYGAVKHDVFLARTRNYSSSREMALAENFIPLEVYDNLIRTVGENAGILQDYVALRRKVLGLDEIHFYDLFVPLVRKTNLSYTFDEAKELVLEALSPLGEDYTSTLRRAFAERWIDVYPRRGKRPGAYAMGIYGSHPYSLQNFTGTLEDVFTLAHELGHVMHSYYSNKFQPYVNSHYTIFTAEVASTVNELLLYKYFLAHNNSAQERAYLLSMHLDNLRSTLFRQTLFADFELQVHEMVGAEQPVTPGALRTLYHDLYKIYYGEEFTIDEELTFEWLRIPHFFQSFYVYQYATGVSAATSLAGTILAGGNADRYLAFLKAGGSDYSINLLRKAGVDMTLPQPLLDTLHDFDTARGELEKILVTGAGSTN